MDLQIENKTLDKLIKLLIPKVHKEGYTKTDSNELYVFHCIRSKNINLLRMLHDNGFDLNLKEINGDTILHLLTEKEEDFNIQGLQYLSITNADFDQINSKGQTPLFNSIKRKFIKSSLIIVKCVKNFMYQNPKTGYTYLHMAVLIQNHQLV